MEIAPAVAGERHVNDHCLRRFGESGHVGRERLRSLNAPRQRQREAGGAGSNMASDTGGSCGGARHGPEGTTVDVSASATPAL